MKISTAVYVGLGAACSAVIGLAISVYLFHSNLERSVQHREDLYTIVMGIAELQIRTEEYLHRFEHRPLHQWQARDRIIEASLRRIDATDDGDLPQLQDLIRRQGEIRNTFNRLVRLRAVEADPFLTQFQQELLNGRLFILFEEQLAAAAELRRATVAVDRISLGTAVITGVMVSFVLLAVLCLAAWNIRRSLALPLSRLLHATRKIGSGNLGYRIGAAPANEIGDLSRAFDSMAERLQLVTASRNQLEQAQDALQELNESLERRVAQRTAELEQLHDELRQVQKMEAIGQLSGGIAHDFNNLLAGMSGNLELMRYQLTEQNFAGLERYIDASLDIVERAAALTHRLLAFSRQQRLDPKPIDVNDLIGSIEELVRRTVGPEIEVASQPADRLPLALSDINQLENVLLNLAVNARDAMPNGGHLTFTTGSVEIDESRAVKLEVAAGRFISIGVRDTGVGMSADVLARAFDPFFTTKPIGQGTGLGLSMAYGFIKQSKGAIHIDSSPGKGTAITLLLPVTNESPAQESAYPQLSSAVKTAGGMTVLLVDDEHSVRTSISQMMRLQKIKIHEASNAADAMRIVQAGGPIDLIISDIGLPGGMSGYELAQAVRRQYRDIPILLITGYPQNALQNIGSLPAGVVLLTKPFMFVDLWAKIYSLMPEIGAENADPESRPAQGGEV